MANYRQIHVKAWRHDEWFLDIPPLDKLLFIYLFSNSSASVSGVYEMLPIKVVAFETGIDVEYIREALDRLEAAGKIMREGGWIWVRNLRKYNASGSHTVLRRIEKDLVDMPEGRLKAAYIAYYNPIDRVSDPIDTLSIPPLEQEQEQETEQEEKIDDEKTSSPPKSPSKRTKKATKKPLREDQLMFGVLGRLCYGETSVMSKAMKGKLNTAVKALRGGGASVGEVGEFSEWWYACDWRGQKDQPPQPSQVVECWGAFSQWNANGRKMPAGRPSAKGLDASKEAITQWAASHGVDLEATSGDT